NATIISTHSHKAGMTEPKKKNFWTVLLSFLKVGTIGFGGGAALIPVIEKELVENKKWMDKRQFDVAVAVSSISPASLPVSLCAMWDTRYALMSAYAYAFPGPFIYLILLTAFTHIGKAGKEFLSFASVGLIAFVLFLLCRFIQKNYRHGIFLGLRNRFVLIIVASFLLTGGKAVNGIADMLFGFKRFGVELAQPLFAIDIIHLMLLTIFVICFVGNSKSQKKIGAAIVFGLLYALAVGKAGVLQDFILKLAAGKMGILQRLSQHLVLLLAGVMFVMTGTSIACDILKKKTKTEKKPIDFNFKHLRNMVLFILIALAFTGIVYLTTMDANVWDYAFKVVTSSLTSFGGGEVYIAVAENAFVDTEFISSEIFHTQIVGIANSMPGPVLVAIATGVGFTYGNETHNSPIIGWIFGLLGLSLTVTATAFGALLLMLFFDILKHSPRLHMVIQYIMPVVCGLLITTALTLLRTSASVITRVSQFNPFLSAGIVLALCFVMLFVYRKYKVNDLILLLVSGAGTLIWLGMIR
ncbi:MAG: chromate transporter, partial [Phycisphaerales bacterium]|nr:chromate transporter [Phycisphaerales bacterium]